MGRRKKSKKKPQKSEQDDQKVPRTMLFSRGKLNPLLRRLQQDLRRMLLPHTAAKLKVSTARMERKLSFQGCVEYFVDRLENQFSSSVNFQASQRNTMKDFLQVAGPLGVTHFLLLSSTEKSAYLRVARTPRGPTLTFRICSYSLAADVANAQTRPRVPPGIFDSPPLVWFLADAGRRLDCVNSLFSRFFPPRGVTRRIIRGSLSL